MSFWQPLTFPANEEELLERLSRPGPQTVELFSRLEGGLLVLGAGGKMGPALCLMAQRSLQKAARRDFPVVAVSRFSNPGVQQLLQRHGVQTLQADLAQRRSWAQLPRLPYVIWMLGHKFSASDPPGTYWVRNVCLVRELEQLAPCRVVAFSSGNVYPFLAPEEPAATEQTPVAPRGEYAITVWGREQVLRHLAATAGMGVCLLRLNYAVELRYGVLVDLAQMIRQGQPVPLSVPELNLVWQGYANRVALACLEQVQPGRAWVLNLTGPERLQVRQLALELGRRLGCPVNFSSQQGARSLVADASQCHRLFGPPELGAWELVDWTARWFQIGGPVWNKPTKFWVTTGEF